MKAILVAAALVACATAANAQGRPSSTQMTCRSVHALVSQRGAIVLGTGGDTYDRFVASEFSCATGLFARPAFVPTRDDPQCNIGFYCTDAPPFFGR